MPSLDIEHKINSKNLYLYPIGYYLNHNKKKKWHICEFSFFDCDTLELIEIAMKEITSEICAESLL